MPVTHSRQAQVRAVVLKQLGSLLRSDWRAGQIGVMDQRGEQHVTTAVFLSVYIATDPVRMATPSTHHACTARPHNSSYALAK